MDTELYRMGFFSEDFDTLDVDINGEIADVKALKIFYVENATYYFTMYAVKAAMLCFYTRLIPRSMRKTRLCLWITVSMVAIGFIVSTLLDFFLCLPISRNWDPEGGCSSGWTSVAGSVVPYVFHLLTDIMIYILPFPVIRMLPLPTSQKIGVGITFALGFLCIFFAVTVIVVGYVSSSATTNWIVAVFEETWCVCVACAPALKSLTSSWDLQHWRCGLSRHREGRSKSSDSDAGTATGSAADVSRPPSDATVLGQEEDQQPQYHTNSLRKQLDSMMAYEEKLPIHSPRVTHSPPKITPIVAYNRQSHDTDYQMSNPSSPGYTMSIASIVDFYDLERQLQLDDERRQAVNCSPVLERRSSEMQSTTPSPV
ncbi:hypothetical protein H072_9742 [Dactylellina haptotyla CBS 200.50]|uniref:Rhodopsin domain-containing protein n=1 Tax=Dactylellina haptotyla (strain CBS 200.50) TaxID=1284197 RepID=S8BBX3_DACHA|nr:hypothetical protein H072_9742 [Dactylellina haptotyla CBS 200.50]